MTAVRNSLLLSLRQRVNDLPGLIDALDAETLPGTEQADVQRLTAENDRLREQVQAWMRQADSDGLTIQQISRERGAAQDRAAKAEAEVERLTAELAKYTGWEPTVKQEYDHTCGQLDAVHAVVEAFTAGPMLGVNQFVADLKNALEMP